MGDATRASRIFILQILLSTPPRPSKRGSSHQAMLVYTARTKQGLVGRPAPAKAPPRRFLGANGPQQSAVQLRTVRTRNPRASIIHHRRAKRYKEVRPTPTARQERTHPSKASFRRTDSRQHKRARMEGPSQQRNKQTPRVQKEKKNLKKNKSQLKFTTYLQKKNDINYGFSRHRREV